MGHPNLRGIPTIVTKDVERAPRTRALIEWMKGIASKFVGSSELSLDDKEFEQIARDLNLSVSELHALSRKDDSSANLF
jgi:predicted RNase H-like nuclease (RuvC/YqgF family)